MRDLCIDILRYIVPFLNVKDALNLQYVTKRKLYETSYFKKIHFYEKISTTKDNITVVTQHIQNTLLSNVIRNKKQFIIRHNEHISTRQANRKVFETLKGKLIRKRLEMVGMV